MKTPTLETERLILRAITLDDAPAIQKHVDNWNVVKYLSRRVPWPYPEDGAETFIRDICLPSVEAGRQFVWVIALKDEDAGEAVGIMEYRFFSEDSMDGDRGFWLAEHLWGKGLMTEAAIAMQDYMFFEYGISEMIVCNTKDNIGSSRIKQKSGAEFIENRLMTCHAGELPSEAWRLTREGWAQFRGVPLVDLPDIQGTPAATDHLHPRSNKP